MPDDVRLLDLLGKCIPFEIAVGQNGRVWLETSLILIHFNLNFSKISVSF